ncbi:MAG: 4Fe-4S dicluster domain-containing protein [Actinobacteria bacterium]|nr:4Fe-4S dicluster domain-containing protein [Actinomycetota bacterium]
MNEPAHPAPDFAPAPRAFDAQRPPESELIDDCIHCGLCLPACPTYVLWGQEADSPRGRIVLMKAGLDDFSEMSEPMVTHFDRCLGCMACVTACPSGVRYDKLIEATRPQIERNYKRSGRERGWRRLMFAVFTHPTRLRALVPLLIAYQRAGGERMVNRIGGPARWPRLRALLALAPTTTFTHALGRVPETSPAHGAKRARVGLLQGCIQRVFFGDVNAATMRVLSAEGFEVYAPSRVRCCGALMFHSGSEVAALALAKRMISAFEDCDYVAVNAAGCGSSMKDYAHVLRDDPQWSERAEQFSAKVRDVSELLAGFEPVARRHPVPLRLAYHDACHLAHAQQVRMQPRSLLSAIPDVEICEPDEWELCCGSAGIYNLLQPEAAGELGVRKAKNLLATGADAIASGNPGCTLQIVRYLREAGRSLPVYHPMQVVDASIRGRKL